MEIKDLSRSAILENLAEESYRMRELMFGEENMRELEKVVMLRIVDNKWMEHLDHMDMLREGINLRAYGQRNPLVEYKIEALEMFEEMEGAIQDQIATLMYHAAIVLPTVNQEEGEAPEEQPQMTEQQKQQALAKEKSQLQDHLSMARASHGDNVSAAEAKKKPVKENGEKVGRNDPCPCGSGKKYKNCCGRNK